MKLVSINVVLPAALIEEALAESVRAELEQLSCNLSIARRIWRHHRTLVEAAAYPEPYRSLEIEMNGAAPDESEDEDPYFGFSLEQLRENLLPDATATAKLLWRFRSGQPDKLRLIAKGTRPPPTKC
jgi:hypothetical protein